MTGYSNYDIFMNYCENMMDDYDQYDDFGEYDYDDLEDFGSGGYRHQKKLHDEAVREWQKKPHGKDDLNIPAIKIGKRMNTTHIKNPDDRREAMRKLSGRNLDSYAVEKKLNEFRKDHMQPSHKDIEDLPYTDRSSLRYKTIRY